MLVFVCVVIDNMISVWIQGLEGAEVVLWVIGRIFCAMGYIGRIFCAMGNGTTSILILYLNLKRVSVRGKCVSHSCVARPMSRV